MAKPSETTNWNTSLSNNVEPSLSKKQLGWVLNEKPASSYFNWYMNLVEQWMVWLNGFESTAHIWGAQQTFTGTAEPILSTANANGTGVSGQSSGTNGVGV
jgi:hypothetical protein